METVIILCMLTNGCYMCNCVLCENHPVQKLPAINAKLDEKYKATFIHGGTK